MKDPEQMEKDISIMPKYEDDEVLDYKLNILDVKQGAQVIIKEEADPNSDEYSAALSLTSNKQNDMVEQKVVKQEIEGVDTVVNDKGLTKQIDMVGHEELKQENKAVEINDNGLAENEDDRDQIIETSGVDAGEKKMYTCEYCHKSFSRRSSLLNHWNTHTGETPYCCPFCDKKFSVRSNRNVHMLIHTGERPHECEVCNKSFRQTGQLKQHMRIHKGEKPYSCKTCFKSFRNSSALVTHQRIHTGEKPYNCSICSRSFTTSTSLKTHQVTHTGTMQYDCPVCGRQFNRRNNLNVHIKRHDKNRSFTCPICCNGFVMRAHLLRHVHRCHKVQLTVDDLKITTLQDDMVYASGKPNVDPVSDLNIKNTQVLNCLPQAKE